MARSGGNLKERILKVAGEKFLSQGFYRVPMDSLVAELRTSKSSLYKYFESKEALVGTLVEQVNDIIDRQLAQMVDHPQWTFEQKLTQVSRFTSKVQRLVSPAFLEDLRIHTPNLWDLHRQRQKDRVQQHYLHLFRAGVREGSVRRDMDLQFLVAAYLKLAELTYQPDNPPPPQEDVFEQLTTLFLEGVLAS